MKADDFVVAVLEAYEDRLLYQPTEELQARHKVLREKLEHEAEAAQNRALMTRENAADACRQHASVLIELAAHEEILGLTGRDF